MEKYEKLISANCSGFFGDRMDATSIYLMAVKRPGDAEDMENGRKSE